MRSELLTPVQYIKGVGPKVATLLDKCGIQTVADLLNHFPFRYIDRRRIDSIRDVQPGKDKTIIGEVLTSGMTFLGRRHKKIFEVVVGDETGEVSAKWFHFFKKTMEKRFEKGTRVLLTGELTSYNGEKQFVHPEVEILAEDSAPSDVSGRIISIYPSTEGLSQRYLRKIIKNAWERYGSLLTPHMPDHLKKRHKLLDYPSSVETLHFPDPESDVEELNAGRSSAHKTLIFDEFFVLELGLALMRRGYQKEEGIAFEYRKGIYEEFKNILPFKLTGAQDRVISEIVSDLEKPHPMHRLVQGDVGSGKTVVGLAVAVQVITNGYQVAFMAPTEILAEQHFKTIQQLIEKKGLSCALLTASTKGAVRDTIYRQVAEGNIPIIVGTHALIQDELKFHKLGLAIIDEQHRFGVMQRAALKKKGLTPDILVMTATPIPRTLAMTVYGDLDVSSIDEMPIGRKPILTRVFNEKQRARLYEGIRIELEKGHQAYVVYPLIEESEKVDLKNATEMAEELRGVFSPDYKVALLHGRMKAQEKEAVMSAFKAGEVHVLAATSVVEVGVDVPNATVMVIEHAERFGLSQLHQLRGRVGRSTFQSYCILVAEYMRSEEARQRLKVMTETNDGFKIAEEDLNIRGPGEFLGTRQSGMAGFKVANLVRDMSILQDARKAAFDIIDVDPELKSAENLPLREILNTRWKGRLELVNVG